VLGFPNRGLFRDEPVKCAAAPVVSPTVHCLADSLYRIPGHLLEPLAIEWFCPAAEHYIQV